VLNAHEEEIATGKALVEKKIPCEQLSEEQLEAIGDYEMEQMHPGEAHEQMDEMMGGEGSDSLKQMHIMMAKRLYCQENSGGMMPMMMNMMGSGNMMDSGMMGGMYGGMGGWFSPLYTILLIGLIILVYLWIVKLWKDIQSRRR